MQPKDNHNVDASESSSTPVVSLENNVYIFYSILTFFVQCIKYIEKKMHTFDTLPTQPGAKPTGQYKNVTLLVHVY